MSRKKMATSAEKLCAGQAAPFRRFCDAVMSMRFEEEPKYCALTALFEPLVCGALGRPIVIDANTLRVRKTSVQTPSRLSASDTQRPAIRECACCAHCSHDNAGPSNVRQRGQAALLCTAQAVPVFTCVSCASGRRC